MLARNMDFIFGGFLRLLLGLADRLLRPASDRSRLRVIQHACRAPDPRGRRPCRSARHPEQRSILALAVAAPRWCVSPRASASSMAAPPPRSVVLVEHTQHRGSAGRRTRPGSVAEDDPSSSDGCTRWITRSLTSAIPAVADSKIASCSSFATRSASACSRVRRLRWSRSPGSSRPPAAALPAAPARFALSARNEANSSTPSSVSPVDSGHAMAWTGAALPSPEEICR